MKHFIETHFGVVLLLACLFGLAFEPLGRVPNASVVAALAGLMFIACYRLRDGGIASVAWRDIALFYVARYVALPAAMWAVAHAIAPQLATGVFLLALVPAGVASPAFASMYGGAVAPAFAIVIVSQLLTPLVIPLQFAWQGSVAAGPEPAALFTTMLWCIVLPMVVYAFVRKHEPMRIYVQAQNKLFSVLLVAFVIAVAIAKQRDVILSGEGLLQAFIATSACFMGFIVFAWYLFPRRAREERIAYATCSSFNNAALGVSLALLHFPAPVVLFVAVSEISWSLLPFMFRFFLARIAK
jgi:BASS family bile acid:Na+ symporter